MTTSIYIRLFVLLFGLTLSASSVYATINTNKVSKENMILNQKSNSHDRPKKKTVMHMALTDDMINFEAIKNGEKVNISWTNTSKIAVTSYTLERSKNGINFTQVSVTDAPNNPNNIIQHIETDYKPLAGITYYRLRYTYSDNNNTYCSNFAIVNYTVNKTNLNYPSKCLSKDEVLYKLKRQTNPEVLLVVKDENRNQFQAKVDVSIENSSILGFDSENQLPTGHYIITATSNNLLYGQNIIIVKKVAL